MKKLLTITILILLSAELQSQGKVTPKPILTGYTFVRYETAKDEKEASFGFSPILLMPIGERILIETEFELETESVKEGDESWETETEKEFEYLQVDFLAHKYLTVVAGRFLIPFGTYIERLHPAWIKNLQATPYTFGLLHHSGNGAMLRGGARMSNNLNLNYATYYTFKTEGEKGKIGEFFESDKSFGGRASIFVPLAELELGASFNQMYEPEETIRGFGLDLTKQFREQFLDIRAEYSNFGVKGSAYWLEGAHRFLYVPFLEPFFERSQLVARWEQFIPKEKDIDNTSRISVGWNLYIIPDLKLSLAYGRTFTSGKSEGKGDFAISWRF